MGDDANPLIFDRSHAWEIQRIFTRITHLTLRCRNTTPSLLDLIAIRKILPEWQNQSPAVLQSILQEQGELCLGEMSAFEAKRICQLATQAGLIPIAKSAAHTSFAILDRTTGQKWFVPEHEAKTHSILQAMLAAGIPANEIEID